MEVNGHDELNYIIVDDIKIYTGTTKYSLNRLNDNIEYYKELTGHKEKLFTELIPSTLTAKGKFNNICFNEEEIIDMLSEPSGGYILKIGCNYGEYTNKTPNYVHPPPKIRVSNRGRKPKTKNKSKRKLQGTGAYFSSQITFNIYNPDNTKIYKTKLFRNGGFQVPGVNKPNMTDLIKPIHILRDYLRSEFIDDNITVLYFVSVMRNYICKLKNPNLLIRLNALEVLLREEKATPEIHPSYEIVDKINIFNENVASEIKKYIWCKGNRINMAEIQNNCERYFGLILKFYRPMPWKLNKRTTIKILRSGKINIDGANSIEEAYELYHWLENIFVKNYSTILYDPNAINDDSEPYNVLRGVEIYDNDITDNDEPTNTAENVIN